ncbi:YqzE family protein [Paenibacillus psychroresistens]|uniref:YqzE family protein n=1 Tax=Paenibacillus psychroresistens TaxID=1778678 RepID=A0A6B8RNT2_9BACL|nr:YqzE family protein [Paenibacillus psychroresistens]QGQ97372.1 YqzE family protein [Paenibacillus psychroresistens]
MADKGEELVQYITEKVAHYMDTPKEERKRNRKLRNSKEAWLTRWFGVVPFAFSMWLDQRKKKLKRR